MSIRQELAPTLLLRSLGLRAAGPLLNALAYLGELGLLALAAVRELVRPSHSGPRLGPALIRQLDGLFLQGLPLVGLIHIGLGSFLAMQAYFGATFTEASGAVVGLGLIRNVAPMLTGFTLAGLLSVRIAAELGGGIRPGLDDDPTLVPDRLVRLGREPDQRVTPDPARVVLVRVASAMLAGPILTLWGAAIGTGIGCLIARAMLAVSPGIYFGMILQMIQFRDAVGLILKGLIYPGVACLLACHEALRAGSRREVDRKAPPAFRAMVLSVLAILFVNFTWFNLAYLSGHPFGPSVVAPSGR